MAPTPLTARWLKASKDTPITSTTPQMRIKLDTSVIRFKNFTSIPAKLNYSEFNPSKREKIYG